MLVDARSLMFARHNRWYFLLMRLQLHPPERLVLLELCSASAESSSTRRVPDRGCIGRPASKLHCRSRVSMIGCFLDVTQRDSGVEGRGDECVPQRVWPDWLGDAGTFGDAAHGPAGAVWSRRCASARSKIGPSSRADGQVETSRRAWCERDRDDLAAFALHGAPSSLRSRAVAWDS